MKKLISAQMVKQARADGKKEFSAPAKSTIVTSEARDLAEKYEIHFVESVRSDQPIIPDFDQETVQLIIREVLNRLPADKRDPKMVTEAVVQVLSNFKK